MHCEAFDRWLNEGQPPEPAAVARAHARDCARCRAALDAALGLEAWLAAPVTRAPVAFSDRVMARIALAEAATEPARAETAVGPALPWWIEMIAEPVVALALVIAALLAAQAPAWVTRGPAAVASASVWLSGLLDGFGVQLGAVLNRTQADALALALLPVLLVLSIPLYQLSQRLVSQPRRAGLSTAP